MAETTGDEIMEKYAIVNNMHLYRYNSGKYHYRIVDCRRPRNVSDEMVFLEPVETSQGRALKTTRYGDKVQWASKNDILKV